MVQAGQIVALLDTLNASGAVQELKAQLIVARAEARRLREALPIDSASAASALAQTESRAAASRTALRERMVVFGVAGDVDSVAKASLKRIHIGLDVPSADYLAAKAAVEVARASLESAKLSGLKLEEQLGDVRRLETSLELARSRRHREAIRATGRGIVLTEQLEELFGSSVSAGEAIVEIADTHRWNAILRVSERNVHRVHPGDRVTIELPALSTMQVDQIPGTVSAVGWQAAPTQPAPSVVSSGYHVTVRLDSSVIGTLPEGTLRRGYTARGKIVTNSTRAITALVQRLHQSTPE